MSGEIEARYPPPETVDAMLVAPGCEHRGRPAGGLSIALVPPETSIEAGRTATARDAGGYEPRRIVDNVRVDSPDSPADFGAGRGHGLPDPSRRPP
ncbi:MAG: hypothetical protein IPO51_15905 [Dehalococcoidia bacterium]|nr:hypothetical protein [Dehalococcoidia bacterium]